MNSENFDKIDEKIQSCSEDFDGISENLHLSIEYIHNYQTTTSKMKTFNFTTNNSEEFKNIEENKYSNREFINTTNLKKVSSITNIQSIEIYNLESFPPHSEYQQMITSTCNPPFISSDIENTKIQKREREPYEHILTTKSEISEKSEIQLLDLDHRPYFKFHIKSVMVCIVYAIFLKILQSIIGRYCFGGSVCDCSDNNILIKVWTMIVLQFHIGHFTFMIYSITPELMKPRRQGVILQIIGTAIIYIMSAFIIDGKSNSIIVLKYIGTAVNAIIYAVIATTYLRQCSLWCNFLKTHMSLLSSGFILIFLVVTFSQNIKTGLRSNLID